MSKYLTAVGRKTSFLRGKKNQTSLGEGQPSAMTVWGCMLMLATLCINFCWWQILGVFSGLTVWWMFSFTFERLSIKLLLFYRHILYNILWMYSGYSDDIESFIIYAGWLWGCPRLTAVVFWIMADPIRKYRWWCRGFVWVVRESTGSISWSLYSYINQVAWCWCLPLSCQLTKIKKCTTSCNDTKV